MKREPKKNSEPSARALYERAQEAALESRACEMKVFFLATLKRWLSGTPITEELVRPSRPTFELTV